MTIDSRINDFMSLHKGDLSRFLAKAEAKLIELGHDVEAIFADDPAPVVLADDTAAHDAETAAVAAEVNGTEPAAQ
jgi:hypothetical protein